MCSEEELKRSRHVHRPGRPGTILPPESHVALIKGRKGEPWLFQGSGSSGSRKVRSCALGLTRVRAVGHGLPVIGPLTRGQQRRCRQGILEETTLGAAQPAEPQVPPFTDGKGSRNCLPGSLWGGQRREKTLVPILFYCLLSL